MKKTSWATRRFGGGRRCLIFHSTSYFGVLLMIMKLRLHLDVFPLIFLVPVHQNYKHHIFQSLPSYKQALQNNQMGTRFDLKHVL